MQIREQWATTFDAIDATNGESATADHPQLFGHRVTDLGAIAGGATWLGFVAGTMVGTVALTVVEAFLALALLALVPVGLDLAATPRRSGGAPLTYRIAVVGHLPAALGAVSALTLPAGDHGAIAIVLPWVGLTVVIALHGLWRLGSRGVGPVPELAVDAAMVYVPVGGLALLLHVAGISLQFRPIIVLLTGIHYHYAGFVLPLVTGLAGRVLAEPDGGFGNDGTGRVATATTLVIIVNLALIALGITFSPSIEVGAVALFTVAVAGFAILTLRNVVPTMSGLPGALLAVASVSVVLTMALALAYGYSSFPATPEVISIGEMVSWHGTLNAFGFALPALLAFRLADET